MKNEREILRLRFRTKTAIGPTSVLALLKIWMFRKRRAPTWTWPDTRFNILRYPNKRYVTTNRSKRNHESPCAVYKSRYRRCTVRLETIYSWRSVPPTWPLYRRTDFRRPGPVRFPRSAYATSPVLVFGLSDNRSFTYVAAGNNSDRDARLRTPVITQNDDAVRRPNLSCRWKLMVCARGDFNGRNRHARVSPPRAAVG